MERTTLVTNSESETAQLAANLASELRAGDVVLFYGGLGAGKTAFIRGIVAYFDKHIVVTSPTFTLINIYPTNPKIFHFDLYRLRDENDLLDLGFPEYVDSGGIVLVEWAEKCGELLPAGARCLTMEIEGESIRRITMERKDSSDRSRT